MTSLRCSALLLALLAGCGDSGASHYQPGTPITDYALDDYTSGVPVRTSLHRAIKATRATKRVLVLLTQLWCPFCLEEAKTIDRARSPIEGNGGAVLDIVVEGGKEAQPPLAPTPAELAQWTGHTSSSSSVTLPVLAEPGGHGPFWDEIFAHTMVLNGPLQLRAIEIDVTTLAIVETRDVHDETGMSILQSYLFHLGFFPPDGGGP